jgi:hypothetical protein
MRTDKSIAYAIANDVCFHSIPNLIALPACFGVAVLPEAAGRLHHHPLDAPENTIASLKAIRCETDQPYANSRSRQMTAITCRQ